jgi:hypothetical protein
LILGNDLRFDHGVSGVRRGWCRVERRMVTRRHAWCIAPQPG